MNAPEIDRAATFETTDDLDAINRLYRERRWSDGLPIVPPTRERVDRMLAATPRGRYEVVTRIAPAYGAATVERIAINAVMAGCDPEYLPVLIAACEAVAEPQFNLQGIQATTNPVAVWLVVNGPLARKLNMNAGFNCIGQGTWANATIGRAMRLVLQNIDTRPARQVHILLCGERSGEPVGPAACRARVCARGEHRHGHRGRRHDEHEHAFEGGTGARARDGRYHGAPAEQRVRARR
jgi:hypothetical protein